MGLASLNPSYAQSARHLPTGNSGSTSYRRCFEQNLRSLHRAFVVEAILAVLDDGRDGFQRELAVGVLHHVLQIEILDRDVIVAVFERTAQRLEIGLLYLGLHG